MENGDLFRNDIIDKAICFATAHHAGQVRKGTHTPYILHPLESMIILKSMKADDNLLIAGVLHDILEDTDATREDIVEHFGTDVAILVGNHSEDKSKTWEERKTHAIHELEKADRRTKMLVMADKVSNLRSIAADYSELGDALWSRFNAPMEKQSWYYSGIADALYDMQFDPATAPVYWEMTALYKDVFVKYYRSTLSQGSKEEYLLQVPAHELGYRLIKGNPGWNEITSEDDFFNDECYSISRKDAEALEDRWNEPFWECIDRDIQPAEYELLNQENRFVEICLKDGKLVLNGEDYGPECEIIDAKDEYEYHIKLDEDNTKRLVIQLRNEYGIDLDLGAVFSRAFGSEMPSSTLMDCCKKKHVKYEFASI